MMGEIILMKTEEQKRRAHLFHLGIRGVACRKRGVALLLHLRAHNRGCGFLTNHGRTHNKP